MKQKDLTKISNAVRQKVYERDSYDGAACCIYCGRPYPEVHHYVERSRGGLGIEQNLVCLCHKCHMDYHNTGNKAIKRFIKEYLQDHYEEWAEDALTGGKEQC